MNRISFTLLLTFCTFAVLGQSQTQNIRGTIIDKDSKFPIIGANVVLLRTDPPVGTVTDVNGDFELKNVPIGRQSLKFTFIGYKEVVLNNVAVVSGKELSLHSIELEESVTALQEIVILAQNEKAVVNNEMALVSARSFDIEETGRFAGSLNDPARMAANFAGVASANDGRNDVIIRGNSPGGVLWRLEGLDIPSPNHYGSLGATGGPVSMLNNNQLAKSDFLTAAFPAAYGNAIAGVFDLQLRNGNTNNHEFLAQAGFNGFELGAEGPLSQDSRASYLINYRYSTLGFFDALGIDFGTGAAVPEYQDLSFKLNFPRKNGRLSIFGLGGLSDIELLGSEEDLDQDNLFGSETSDVYNSNLLGLAGISYTHFFNSTTFAKVVTGFSRTEDDTQVDSLVYSGPESIESIFRNQNILYQQDRFTTHLLLNKKFNARNTVVAGAILDQYMFNIDHDIRIPNSDEFRKNRDFDGSSLLSKYYAQWQHKFSDKVVINPGITYQHFALSGSNAIEPRIGLKYQFKPNQSFNIGYGRHNQLQPVPLYFQTEQLANGTAVRTNEDLDFVQSDHYVMGYDRSLGNSMRMKIEAYYQDISDAGVRNRPSSFSVLNVGADFDIPNENNLVNGGTGENYGLEFTLEKFFSRQYYFLLTSSLFESKYQGSDGISRNTAFNGRYIFNLLGGKEWNIGNNILAIDARVTGAGGRYYTPVDLEASQAAGREILQEERAFSERLSDYFRADLKISYRINKAKITHEWGLDLRNITNRENDFNPVYNRRTNEVVIEKQTGLFPVPMYKLYF